MKSKWFAFLVWAGNLAAFAQGQVNFDTHVTTATPPVDARIIGPDGVPWTDGYGELVIVGNGGSLTPLTPIGAFGTGAEAGYINAGTATAPAGFPGGTTVNLVLRAWLGSAGSTFDSSTWKGQTAPITITLTESPDVPNDLIGLTGFTLIPEPTAAAFGVTGIAALLLRKRISHLINP